ncbi:MAG: GNAT family N-acetyltransferase [Myxococcaceae bacterium]|nr:MAG: GNAT family N-acetyltransferase [Myxococcaceae bacterium]
MLLSPTPPDVHAIRIALHHGSRHELWSLFELADDSAMAIRRYLDLGLVHVASLGGVAIGHAQIVPHDVRTWELRSLAVLGPYRARGVGTGLVRRSIAWVREHGAAQLLVATASADLDTLGFYQRLGFRMLRIERNAFTPEGGYPVGLSVRGVPVRDRVWLEIPL